MLSELTPVERRKLLDAARAHRLEQQETILPSIAPAERGRTIPMSFAQQRLWFLAQMDGVSDVYHIPFCMRARGELNAPAMRAALDRIVQRHEALRTTFGLVNGEPVQRIGPADNARFELVEHDLRCDPDAASTLRRLIDEEATASFDLEHGPLLRGRLIRDGEFSHVLLVTTHHIVSDGWSMGVFSGELSALYNAFARGEADPLQPLRTQYADYAIWQREWIAGDMLQRQVEFWKGALRGAPALLALPTDRPRQAQQDFAGAFAPLAFDAALTARVKAFSRNHDTTVFTTLLAAWSVVLARLSGQEDFVVGTPVANRGQAEIEAVIGFFVNTLAMRMNVTSGMTVRDLVAAVKSRALAAQQNQDLPFEQVVEAVQPRRSLAYSPVVQVMLVWQNTPRGSLVFEGLELGSLERGEHAVSKFDVSLVLQESGDTISGGFEYATSLFDVATMERFEAYLRNVLEAMLADDGREVGDLDMLPPSEREALLCRWNGTAREIPDASLPELFAAQVLRTPHAVAVQHGDVCSSYSDLDRRSDQLAARLRAHGVGDGSRVALALERSIELVAAQLAVTKCGAAYVPIDPDVPDERLRFVLDDADVTVIVSKRQALRDGVAGARTVVDIDAPLSPAGEEAAFTATPVGSGAVAFVMYTSGSTGRPKGVMVPHRAVVRMVLENGYAALRPDDRVTALSNPAFDASTFEVWAPLLTGARVVIVDKDIALSPALLVRELHERGITILFVTTALFNQLALTVPEALGALRYVLFGGEAVDPHCVEAVLAHGKPAHLLHLYGPTEATTFATWYEVVAPEGPGQTIPIGRPIGNTSVYILDARRNPVPVGVAGEIYIGGMGVALGYFNRPELTQERFIASPFVAGDRLYKTGDLARYRADGAIEYLGRNDDQVKLRGFRIELGEIESSLLRHGSVGQAAVTVRSDDGEKQLVAYYTSGDDALTAQALRAHCAGVLPSYMVPAAFVRLDALPLTPNGKTDRQALPPPDASAYALNAYEPPQGTIETALAEIWSKLLKVERVGRHDDFFELGGHSLLAVRVALAVQRELGVELRVREFFANPVLHMLADSVRSGSPRAESPIVPVDGTAPIPMSFAQQRLWFLAEIDDVSEAYSMPFAFRLDGALDVAALRSAIGGVVARHDALRTTFGLVDGTPVQHIAPAETAPFVLREDDVRSFADPRAEVERAIAEEMRMRFDLKRGPVFRARLVRETESSHTLVIAMHHIVSDGWSMGVFFRELAVHYDACLAGAVPALDPLPVQYADYSAWQRAWLSGEELEAQGRYWQQTLAGAPALLDIPLDHPRRAVQDHTAASVSVRLDATLTAGLKSLSRRHGTTLFMTLVSAWGAVLSRLSGQSDVLVGTPVANRDRPELEGLIGFFVNTLVLRLEYGGNPTIREVLARVKARAIDSQAHQALPFEQVVELVNPERSLAHSALFQAMFIWQNNEAADLVLPGLEVAPIRGTTPIAKFDLSLGLQESGGEIAGMLEYASALFDRPTIERYVEYLRNVLTAMVADDTQHVERISMLSEAERHQVVTAWNATERAFPDHLCVHELIEARVAAAPDAVAVRCEDTYVTYGELNARANRLARHLRALGAGPDQRIGLCVDAGVERVVGLLAILKAGAAYVPLDPSYPLERLRFLVEDSSPVAVLTHARTPNEMRHALYGMQQTVVDLDADAHRWAREPAANLAGLEIAPHHLAYVIHTSGSTGRPKAAMVEHRSCVNRITAQDWFAPLFDDDVFSHKSALGFVDAFFEIVVPLCYGRSLVVIPRAVSRDAEALFAELDRAGVTNLVTVPSLAAASNVQQDDLPKVRSWLLSGEVVSSQLARRLVQALPACRFTNVYGATELTSDAVIWSFGASTGVPDVVPIGRPIANTRVYILDAHREPVPIGTAGEIYVGGVQVARGYLGRDDLNAERFLPNPFVAGDRLYRTGDLGRYRPDGTIEFLARNDFQVKIRGIRIEPGEIEACLAEHRAVREAIVIARTESGGEQRLVAYHTPVGEGATADELRAHLASRLPQYMIPAAFVRLEAFPSMPNGKADRRALPAPDAAAHAASVYEAPRGAIEVALAETWSTLLHVERIGRRDNFFHLGGHSLLAVRAVSALREKFGLEVAVRDFFAHPVLEDLARGVRPVNEANRAPIVPVERTDRMPMSFAQQRLWFMSRIEGASEAYHIPFGVWLKGDLDARALRDALNRIVERHEALRTTFAFLEGQPVQRVLPADRTRFVLHEHDLREEPDAQAEMRRLADVEATAPFDLEQGPLIRGRLMRDGESSYGLLVTMHHIVADGWSLGVFARELSTLYNAFVRGEGDPLPPLAVQYADYAGWQRGWIAGEKLEQQAQYWLETLAGAPTLLELPTDRPRPARQEFPGGFARIELDASLTSAAKALSRKHETTLFMTVLTAWSIVLARLSGQDDLVIGTPVANRGRAEIEALIGLFVNTLAVRLNVAQHATVGELLADTKLRALAAQQHQDIPFEQVVELVQPVRSLAHSPVVQAAFVWQNAATGKLAFNGVETAGLPRNEHQFARFDLTITLSESGDRIAGGIEYPTSLFDAPTIERFGGYLRAALEAMAADDGRRVGEIDLLSPDERERIVDTWNETARAVPDASVPALFEAQVRRTPHAVAIQHDEIRLTYAELNRRADRLAEHLRAHGVDAGSRVVVVLERSIGLVVAELAIVKCGAAYVPLDPEYPAERLRFVLEDTGAAVVVTSGQGVRDKIGQGRTIVDVDARLPDRSTDPVVTGAVGADALAYVMYTSGSTGQPKGVMVSHRAIVRLVLNNGYADLGPNDRVAFESNPAFDATTFEVWGPLLSGGSVVVVDQATLLSPASFGRLLDEQRVTVLFMTIGLFNQYADALAQHFAKLRYIITGGDALDPKVMARVLRQGRPQHLLSAYGPTETTTFATTYEITAVADDARSIPIGRPIGNTRIYVLDERRNPVPTGVVGELYIGGTGVALGYLNRPQWTDERFIASPFVSGDRLYKTGDLGYQRSDGTLEFVGRNDSQVKVRGFRIELGDIQSSLVMHPSVDQALVIARTDGGEKELVAYYTSDDAALTAEALRAHLANRLPGYMVPAAFVQLAALPLTSNGKVNREALPAPGASSYASTEYEAPHGEVEVALADIWTSLLRVERVGRHDNFFDLGGHSLLALRVATKVRERLHADVALPELFAHPVLKDLADLIGLGGQPSAGMPNLIAEVRLDETIGTTQNFEHRIPRAVFLTGATGFLGAFLLESLLDRTDATVHCLVRCRDADEGRHRLESALREYGIAEACDFSRIVVVPGDLGRPLLGLTRERFDELAAQVDAVYHNGASISAVHGYEMLEAANVRGTEEILRLAATSRLKPVHYVSTMSVFPASVPEGSGVTTEAELLQQWQSLPTGYAQSKWVAEQLLGVAASRGIRSAIYRPTYISGSTRSGATNSTDSWSRFIDACLELECVPAIDADINMLPVDYLARVIVDLSLREQSLGESYNLLNPETSKLREVIACLLAVSNGMMQEVPMDEWLERCAARPSTMAIGSLLSGSGRAASGVRADVTLRNAFEHLDGVVPPYPAITDELLRSYVLWRRDRQATLMACT
jgi:amino acid adenylation domain-containing protein/thioester reductase-like protein